MARWVWQNSEIVRVIDGDTVDAKVTRDIGFGGFVLIPVRLRLNRINCPSKHSRAGKEAMTATIEKLPLTTRYSIETVSPYKYGGPADQNGEWMAEVTLPDGSNLSDWLVANQYAVYWNGQGPRPHDDGHVPPAGIEPAPAV